MALQIRRGTNKERLQITPAEGELIYVTDYELATISATALNATTNVLTSVAHGLTTNQQIRFQDTTKNGLTLNQVYYVASTPDPDTFTLKATLAGATLDITGTYTTPLVFAITPTNALGQPLGINVTALWIGDGNTVGGVPGNTQGLDDLTDVQITTPAEGNTLYYDATTKQWKNTNILNIDDVSGTQNIIVNGTGASQIRATNTNTNLGYTILDLVSKTTATPVNGFGSSIRFTANNIAGTEQPLGYINFNYDDITAGSEDAGISIGLMEAGVSPLTPPGTVSAQLKLKSNGDLYLKGGLELNSAEITSTLAGGIANLYNNNAVDTINIGNSVVTEVNIGNGANSSRVRIKSPTIVGLNTTQNVFNTVATTVNAFGAATTLNLGAGTGTTTINNNAVVTGNLTVNGTTTTVNSTTMTVDDPNMVLNAVGTPTDANANGGGITVKGTTDKSLNWDNTTKRWWFTNGTGGNVDGNYPMVVDLTDIRNVETTAFNLGQMLVYDGTNWVNSNKITYNSDTYRTTLNTQVNNAANQINSALVLLKDYDTNTYGTGAGTGIVMGLDSNSQGSVGISRIATTYDAGGAHNITLQSNITSNTYNTLIETNTARTNINNGVLYVNATNGRVGINTVSPNLSLEVQGNAYVSTTLEVIQDITARSNINVGGETITMNYGFTGNPTQDVGLVVERGNSADTSWKWIENNDWWGTDDTIWAGQWIIGGQGLATNGRQVILNNSDQTPISTDHALLTVQRGSGANVYLRWNETNDRWDFTNDGSTYTNIPVATDTPTYAGLNTTSGNVNVNNKTYLYGNTGDVRIGNDVYIGGDMLRFNEAQTGTPTLSANIVAERGSQPDVTLRWNEGVQRWQFTNDGSGYISLHNQMLDSTSSPMFESLTLNGNATLGSDSGDTITMNGLVAGNIAFTFNDAATPRGILGKTSTGVDDFWFIGGAEADGTSNSGYAMIATGDDGTEAIYARQYTGSPIAAGNTNYRQLTLLDSTGNTTLPGTLFANTISGAVGALQLTSPNTQHIKLTPGTTGNVLLESSTVGIGDPGSSGNLTTNGAGDLVLNTNNSLNSGSITITNGVNGAITLAPNGTGSTNITSDVAVTGNLTITGNTIKKSSGTDVITFSGTNLTTFAGDIKLGGNTVYDSAGNNVLDFKTSTSIYGTSYQAKFNTSVNYGVGCSYLFLDNIVEINTSSKTTTQNSTYEVLDFFDPASYRSAKYIVQISNGTTHQMWEGMVIHDGTDIFVTAYGDIRTNGNLATISVGFNATTGYAELRVTPVNATQTKFKATKTYIVV